MTKRNGVWLHGYMVVFYTHALQESARCSVVNLFVIKVVVL